MRKMKLNGLIKTKTKKIIGIDYSLTSPAICVMDGDKLNFYYLTSKKKYDGKMSDNIEGQLHDEWDTPMHRFGLRFDCPAGQYGNELGLIINSCSGKAAPGYYTPPGSTSATQKQCPAGRYGTGGNVDEKCTGPCAKGHYCRTPRPKALRPRLNGLTCRCNPVHG